MDFFSTVPKSLFWLVGHVSSSTIMWISPSSWTTPNPRKSSVLNTVPWKIRCKKCLRCLWTMGLSKGPRSKKGGKDHVVLHVINNNYQAIQWLLQCTSLARLSNTATSWPVTKPRPPWGQLGRHGRPSQSSRPLECIWCPM